MGFGFSRIFHNRVARFILAGFILILLFVTAVVRTNGFNLPLLVSRDQNKVGIHRMVVYLSPVDASPEIWSVTVDGSKTTPLTHAENHGAKIIDFNVSHDGKFIVFAVENDERGADLWEVDRDGKSEKKLLACGSEECTMPAISIDGKMVAYSRRDGQNGPDIPRIWLLDLNSGNTNPLLLDGQISGVDALWSPDGKNLAFYDHSAQAVHIVNFQGEPDISLPSNLEFSGQWSADGKKIYYGQSRSTVSGRSYDSIFEYDLQTQNINQVLGQHNQADYSLPAQSPDGKWLVYGIRLVEGSLNKQIWLRNLITGDERAITQDETFTYAAYQWAPQGDGLVLQRLRLDSSQAQPEIQVWWMDSGKTMTLAQNAAEPRWLP